MNESDITPGAVLRYTGKSHGMTGNIVKIIGPILGDDGPTGRYEVQPWLDGEGRYSWVTCDATAAEFEPALDAPAAALERDDPTTLVLTRVEETPSE